MCEGVRVQVLTRGCARLCMHEGVCLLTRINVHLYVHGAGGTPRQAQVVTPLLQLAVVLHPGGHRRQGHTETDHGQTNMLHLVHTHAVPLAGTPAAQRCRWQ